MTDLHSLTDRELYRLAFQVSEILVEREIIAAKLEYLRGEIQAERISYGEIAELQSLAHHIQPGDVELLEWAGVPEYDDAGDRYGGW